MFNPEINCPVCEQPWHLAEETCGACGFDPLNDEDDAALYEKALDLYRKMLEARRA